CLGELAENPRDVAADAYAVGRVAGDEPRPAAGRKRRQLPLCDLDVRRFKMRPGRVLACSRDRAGILIRRLDPPRQRPLAGAGRRAQILPLADIESPPFLE